MIDAQYPTAVPPQTDIRTLLANELSWNRRADAAWKTRRCWSAAQCNNPKQEGLMKYVSHWSIPQNG